MMFGFGPIYDLLIIVVILGMQYFLSSRSSIYWGAILPVAFLIWRVYIIFTTTEPIIAQLLVILIGLAFLAGEWDSGRKSLKDKQQKELLKMKALDLK